MGGVPAGESLTVRLSDGSFEARSRTVEPYYGALAGLVRQRGRDPRPRRMDVQIAATAARHGRLLLTRNGADCSGLQSALKIVDLPDQTPGAVG